MPGRRGEAAPPSGAELEYRRKHKGKAPPPPPPPQPAYTPPSSSSSAPAPKLKTARRKGPKKATRLRTVRRLIKEADLPGATDTPQFHYLQARDKGIYPPKSLKREYPKAYRESVKAFHAYHREHEGIKPDPLGELLIDTAVTAGVGAGVKLGAKAVASAAERELLTQAASRATSTTATVAEKAAETGAKAVAKKAATKGLKTARRIAPKEAKRIGKAAGKVSKRPVRYSAGANAAAYPLGVNTDLGKRGSALAEGTAKAVANDPVKTAETTGRALIGSVTGIAALGKSGVESAAAGGVAPLRETTTEQLKGIKGMGEDLLSGDPKRVQRSVEEDVGLSYLAPLPALTRIKALRELGGKVREKVPPLERRAARRRVARRVTQATNPARSQAAYWEKQILKPLKKAPIPRSLRNVHGMEAGDLLQTLAEYGIRTKKDAEYVRKHGPVGEGMPGMVTLKSALDFIDQHPEVLTDKHFQQALDAYIRSAKDLPAARAGKGERARLMAQGDLLGVRRPEDRVPVAARAHTRAKSRAEAWKQVEIRKRGIARDRARGREFAAQAMVAKGLERDRLRARAESFYGAARDAEARNASLVKALRDYSKPGQALRSTARRKYFDRQLLDEYRGEVTAASEKAGLAEPAWTHHQKQREAGEVTPGYPTAAARVEHMRSGVLSETDRVDRSLRALVSGSVVGPRLRAGGQELARRFTAEETIPKQVGGRTKRLVTQDEWGQLVREGKADPRREVLFPARQFKQAVLDPFKSQAEVSTLATDALEAGLKADTPGTKYVVVSREAAKELAAQINPVISDGMKLVNKVSKGTSRWLLFNPSWVMIQSVAEALPMWMAHPELLNPLKVARLEARIRKNTKLRPSEAKAFAAVAGEAPTTLHTPNEIRPALESRTHAVFSDGARALTKNPIGQALFSLARLRPFAVFDNWRQGKYRELLLAAEADKQLNGWWGGIKGALGIQKRISDEIRKLPKDEQLAALMQPKYRKQLDEMQRHVEAVAGNWNTFTRYERDFAPFLVFYPFIRYSLRWPLTFAKQHPISATVAAFLGQVNAEALEKILGGAPDNPLAYAIPVSWNVQGEPEALMEGRRAAPGLSAPLQAVVSAEPSQALSAFNPLIAVPMSGLTGVNAYTGEQEARTPGEKAIMAINQLLDTSPLARFLDLQVGGDKSIASQRREQIDPRRRQRSTFTPWESLTADQLREVEGFGSDLGTKYSDPVPSLWDNPDIYEAAARYAKGDESLFRKLLKEHRESERASDRVKKQEEPFYGPEEELTQAEQKRFNHAIEQLQGGIFIPTDKEKKAPPGTGIGGSSLGGGIGGPSTGKIGGRPLSGSIGGGGLAKVGGKRARVKLPNIEGFDHTDQKEFAQWFSHYSKIPPKLAGEWVKQEGGGFSNGGEAGEQNWLGVGYPGEPTAFSQSGHFNRTTPKKAAKATVEWMEGKLGGDYGYQAASSIKGILDLARSGAPESQVRSYIEGGSGWGTGAINTAGTVSVSGSVAGTEPKRRGGEWAGTKRILLSAAKGIPISSTKRTPAHNAEIGGSPTSDHLTTNENAFATDLPTTDGVPIAEKVTKRLGIKGWTAGNYDWYTTPKYPGYRFQVLWEVEGHYDHVHVGAEWTGEHLPAGTISGGSAETPAYAGEVATLTPAEGGSSMAVAAPPKEVGEGVSVTPLQRYRRTMHTLKELGVGLNEPAEEQETPVLDRIERQYNL